jgi:hypothetical protein
MKDLYKVKIGAEKGPYLKDDGDVIGLYPIAVANGLAKLHSGEIELHKPSFMIDDELRIAQVSKSSLLPEVLRLLEGRESFTDADEAFVGASEKLYTCDIFDSLLEEFTPLGSLSAEAELQLVELSEQLEFYNYVMLTTV